MSSGVGLIWEQDSPISEDVCELLENINREILENVDAIKEVGDKVNLQIEDFNILLNRPKKDRGVMVSILDNETPFNSNLIRYFLEDGQPMEIVEELLRRDYELREENSNEKMKSVLKEYSGSLKRIKSETDIIRTYLCDPIELDNGGIILVSMTVDNESLNKDMKKLYTLTRNKRIISVGISGDNLNFNVLSKLINNINL